VRYRFACLTALTTRRSQFECRKNIIYPELKKTLDKTFTIMYNKLIFGIIDQKGNRRNMIRNINRRLIAFVLSSSVVLSGVCVSAFEEISKNERCTYRKGLSYIAKLGLRTVGIFGAVTIFYKCLCGLDKKNNKSPLKTEQKCKLNIQGLAPGKLYSNIDKELEKFLYRDDNSDDSEAKTLLEPLFKYNDRQLEDYIMNKLLEIQTDKSLDLNALFSKDYYQTVTGRTIIKTIAGLSLACQLLERDNYPCSVRPKVDDIENLRLHRLCKKTLTADSEPKKVVFGLCWDGKWLPLELAPDESATIYQMLLGAVAGNTRTNEYVGCLKGPRSIRVVEQILALCPSTYENCGEIQELREKLTEELRNPEKMQ